MVVYIDHKWELGIDLDTLYYIQVDGVPIVDSKNNDYGFLFYLQTIEGGQYRHCRYGEPYAVKAARTVRERLFN